jgi:geranyl-CoA carboxylase beta subunit
VALVLDPGAPFIELSTLAGYRFDAPDPDKSVPGGGVIAGIGFVAGIRCMVSANDAGIDAGALQPYGLDKTLRVQELALENKLPYVQLVESAGANLLRYRVEDFVRGGNIFRNLARLSAAGLPVVTVTHGSSTAGGAYQTGLSDYIVMVRGRTRAFLAGPPLLKAATGEIATEEELGGAEMHTKISVTIWPRTTAMRCASRATSWPIWNGTGRVRTPRRAADLATIQKNCLASCRWTTSGRSICDR